MTNYTKVTWK